MSKVTLYHNPRCSKSRKALELLEGAGADLEIVAYIDAPPVRATLERLAELVGGDAIALVRTGDAAYKDAGAPLSGDAGAAEVVAFLDEHPALMQRPIVAVGDRAVIARPPELALDLL